MLNPELMRPPGTPSERAQLLCIDITSHTAGTSAGQTDNPARPAPCLAGFFVFGGRTMDLPLLDAATRIGIPYTVIYRGILGGIVTQAKKVGSRWVIAERNLPAVARPLGWPLPESMTAPGRPKKSEPTPAPAAGAAAPRKRGRPRKDATVTPALAPIAAAEPKRRGRPKKVQPAEPTRKAA